MPTGDIKFRDEYSEAPAYMKQFTDIPIGTVLYQLIGHRTPYDYEGLVTLGDLVTTDKCVTSFYGDTKLNFKHQYLNEDRELMPEWSLNYDLGCPRCPIS